MLESFPRDDYPHIMELVGVFFDEPGFLSNPFDEEEYRVAYRQIAECTQERGGRFAIVRGQETFLGGNAFRGGWIFECGAFHRTEEIVTLDAIFNRGLFRADTDSIVVNEPAFDDLCTNKAKSYALFPSLFPATIVAHTFDEAAQFLRALPTAMAVAKPVDEEEGRGVFILPKEELLASVPSYPYLFQEFIDTSAGIPGITDAVHDFRIISIRGDFIVAYVRMAPLGSWLANVARGAAMQEVPREHVPAEAWEIFRTVDAAFPRFPDRLYSVDTGRDRSGVWKIIELNAKPGLSVMEQDPGAKRYIIAIVELLLSVAQKRAAPLVEGGRSR